MGIPVCTTRSYPALIQGLRTKPTVRSNNPRNIFSAGHVPSSTPKSVVDLIAKVSPQLNRVLRQRLQPPIAKLAINTALRITTQRRSIVSGGTAALAPNVTKTAVAVRTMT
jgi:hypothetical protein